MIAMTLTSSEVAYWGGGDARPVEPESGWQNPDRFDATRR
jgi:hypothetical protein